MAPLSPWSQRDRSPSSAAWQLSGHPWNGRLTENAIRKASRAWRLSLETYPRLSARSQPGGVHTRVSKIAAPRTSVAATRFGTSTKVNCSRVAAATSLTTAARGKFSASLGHSPVGKVKREQCEYSGSYPTWFHQDCSLTLYSLLKWLP